MEKQDTKNLYSEADKKELKEGCMSIHPYGIKIKNVYKCKGV